MVDAGQENLAKYFDHTLLGATTLAKNIEQLCSEALEHKFYTVCVQPSFVNLANEILRDSPVKVCTVVGFPLGQNLTTTKTKEANELVKLGASEIDMVINLSWLKDGRYNLVQNEINDVVKASESALVKVIIETALLTAEEIQTASKLCEAGGAAFVKTSTGFSTRGACVEDIRLIKSSVSEKMKIKASGGIKTRAFALELIAAGAHRLGSSSCVKIVRER